MSNEKREQSDNNNKPILKTLDFLPEQQQVEIRTYINENIEEIFNFQDDLKKNKAILNEILKVKFTTKQQNTNKLIITSDLIENKIVVYLSSSEQRNKLNEDSDQINEVNKDVFNLTDAIVKQNLPPKCDKESPQFTVFESAILNLVVLLHLPEKSPYLKHYAFEVQNSTLKKSKEMEKNKNITITQKGLDSIKNMTSGEIQKAIQEIAKNDILESQIRNLTSEKNEVQIGLEQKIKEYQALLKTNEELKIQLLSKNTVEQELAVMQTNFLKMKEELQTLKLKSQNNKQENEESQTLKRKIQELTQENDNIKKSVSGLTQENLKLTQEVGELKEGNKKKKRRVMSSVETIKPFIENLLFYVTNTCNHVLSAKNQKFLQKKHPSLFTRITTLRNDPIIISAVPDEILNQMEEKLFFFLKNFENSSNLNTTDNLGWTLVHIASILGDDKTLRELIRKKAEFTKQNSNKQLPITIAATLNHVHIVKTFFENKINAKKKNRIPLVIVQALNESLSYALMANYFEMIEVFLQNGMLLSAKDHVNTMKNAAIFNKLSLLKLLLKHLLDIQANPNEKDKDIIISQASNIEVLKLLIQNGFWLGPQNIPSFIKEMDLGINLNNYSFCALINDSILLETLMKSYEKKPEELETALHLSIIKGFDTIFKTILDHGYVVKPDFDCAKILQLILLHCPQTNLFLSTFFNHAYCNRKLQPKIFWETVQNIQDVSHLNILLQNNYCQITLDSEQVIQFLFKKANESNIDYIIKLISNTVFSQMDTAVISPTFYQNSPIFGIVGTKLILVEAINTNKFFLVEKLLEKGVNVNELLNTKTSLHAAVETKSEKLVELLMKYKANLNLITGKNHVLKLALDLNLPRIVTLLLSRSFTSQNEIDKAVYDVLGTAFKENDLILLQKILNSIPKDLIEKNVDDKLLNILVSRNSVGIINVLTPLNINWNSRNTNGFNVTDFSILLNHQNITRTLKAKIKPNILKFLSDEEDYFSVNKGYSAEELLFFNAALEGREETLKDLISNGMPIDARTKGTRTTALMLAAAKGHTQAVQFLLRTGANPQATNSINLSALDFATLGDYPEIIQSIKSALEIYNDLIPINSAIITLDEHFPTPTRLQNNRYSFHNTSNTSNTSNNLFLAPEITDADQLMKEFLNYDN